MSMGDMGEMGNMADIGSFGMSGVAMMPGMPTSKYPIGLSKQQCFIEPFKLISWNPTC